MTELCDLIVPTDVYDEYLDETTICDLSNHKLDLVPDFSNRLSLCVLYLQNNKIKELSEDFFPSLPSLMWLDLRGNELTEIPKTIKNHPSLTHFLLQNNKLTSLPPELGTVATLKVLQLTGNPIVFPPKEVLQTGVQSILKFLHNQYIDELFEAKVDLASTTDTDRSDFLKAMETTGVSYNSVLDCPKSRNKPMSVLFSEKGLKSASDSEDEKKSYKKCPRLLNSRSRLLPPFCQSAKYLKPGYKVMKYNEVRDMYQRKLALKKRKEYLAGIERSLQERKTFEAMKNWRQTYRYKQLFAKSDHKFDPATVPYDTNLEYMNTLTREDIAKDLPDKYRRRLTRKSKPSAPRKSNADVQLAMKIKQLFEKLEAIDLKKESLTPRSEQKMLLGEIQKITEIKQKLDELSTTNVKSVIAD